MQRSLSYGKKGLMIDLEDSWDVTILSKKRMPVVGDAGSGVTQALEKPLGAGTLEEEARGCHSACLLVCDITRPVPNSLVLRPIIDRLLRAGVKEKAITVLVATGLHRPNNGAELDTVIGDPWVMRHVVVANHYSRNEEDHLAVGKTGHGIPVQLDRRFLEADLRVAIGLVEPHFMAGWSGGRKLILPGIASAESIMAFHSARMLGHPGAATCNLLNNPLDEAQNEVLGMIGKTLAMNLVIDEARALSFASFGAIAESHGAAVAFAQRFFRVGVPCSFPVVVCSAAGYPLDATYYQSVKGICCGASVLSAGGHLLVAAECSEGFGSSEFRASQSRLCRMGNAAFLAEAHSRPLAMIDEWQTVMLAKATSNILVHLFAEGLTEKEHALTHAHPVRKLGSQIHQAMERSGERRIVVIPEGPYVAPFIEGKNAGGGEDLPRANPEDP